MKPILANNAQDEARAQNVLLDMLEARFTDAVVKEIDQATAEMIAAFEATGSDPQLPMTHLRNIEDIYRDLARQSIEIFGGRIVDQGKSRGLVLETKSFDEFFLRLVQQFIGQEAIRKRITSITNRTRSLLINNISRGQEEGIGTDAIARRVSQEMPEINRSRARTIARTETHGAANYGAQGAAESLGLEMVREWVSAEDSRTRPSHDRANGQQRGMDEPFMVGGASLMFPGDPSGPADETINCFHPNTSILLAGIKGGISRKYTGNMVQLSFGGEVNLAVTPNHPILTSNGWVAAGRIVEGDNLVYCGVSDFGEITSCLNVDYGYAAAHQLYRSCEQLSGVVGSGGVIVDLHGEVVTEEVDIVTLDGGLRDRAKAIGDQLFSKVGFTHADVIAGRLLADRMVFLRNAVSASNPDSIMSGGNTARPFRAGRKGGLHPVALADCGLLDAKVIEHTIDQSAGQSKLSRNAVDGMTITKKPFDGAMVALSDDSPSFRGLSFEFRKCTGVKSFHYEGPVYNFESDTGVLIADGIVNHNCRCVVTFTVVD
jgi:hypothetical protein